jgi:hypothetical protein
LEIKAFKNNKLRVVRPQIGKAFTGGARRVAGLDRGGVSATPARGFDPYNDGGKFDPHTDGPCTVAGKGRSGVSSESARSDRCLSAWHEPSTARGILSRCQLSGRGYRSVGLPQRISVLKANSQ